ncbi:14416_t:CDS:2, partial [Racocetra persica]
SAPAQNDTVPLVPLLRNDALEKRAARVMLSVVQLAAALR